MSSKSIQEVLNQLEHSSDQNNDIRPLKLILEQLLFQGAKQISVLDSLDKNLSEVQLASNSNQHLQSQLTNQRHQSVTSLNNLINQLAKQFHQHSKHLTINIINSLVKQGFINPSSSSSLSSSSPNSNQNPPIDSSRIQMIEKNLDHERREREDNLNLLRKDFESYRQFNNDRIQNIESNHKKEIISIKASIKLAQVRAQTNLHSDHNQNSLDQNQNQTQNHLDQNQNQANNYPLNHSPNQNEAHNHPFNQISQPQQYQLNQLNPNQNHQSSQSNPNQNHQSSQLNPNPNHQPNQLNQNRNQNRLQSSFSNDPQAFTLNSQRDQTPPTDPKIMNNSDVELKPWARVILSDLNDQLNRFDHSLMNGLKGLHSDIQKAENLIGPALMDIIHGLIDIRYKELINLATLNFDNLRSQLDRLQHNFHPIRSCTPMPSPSQSIQPSTSSKRPSPPLKNPSINQTVQNPPSNHPDSMPVPKLSNTHIPLQTSIASRLTDAGTEKGGSKNNRKRAFSKEKKLNDRNHSNNPPLFPSINNNNITSNSSSSSNTPNTTNQRSVPLAKRLRNVENIKYSSQNY
ncbi:hypothetical protein O181_001263 [Austropuccinia psidii MF-1]|uniref:Uncharacterized protein n=1 Tax=Austropuccinia psidii MF-1 TaxID=1389203 RepID=A0A9Q3BAF5_9BASI|nr:hypothetical protein [Austropuccinia psidii MF-1]